MNFKSIQGLVEGILKTFKCPDCKIESNEEFIDILGTTGNNINIDVICPNCGKHSVVKAQVVDTPIPMEMILSEEEMEKIENKEMDFMKEKLSKIENFSEKKLESLIKISDLKVSEKDDSLIKDKEIVSLNKSMKSENFSMENLFSD